MARYHEGLQEIHNKKRQETIIEIKDAIEIIKTLEGQNAIITAKKILKNTNLSRSALYKEHALKVWNYELWEEKHVKKSQIEVKLEGRYKQNIKKLQKVIEELTLELKQSKCQIEKLKITVENEKKRREVYELERDELKEKNKKLLAECQRLADIIHAKS